MGDSDYCIDGSSPTVKKKLRVSITLNKVVEVNVSDFKICVDNTEYGDFPYFNFDDTDFEEAVLEQVDLPEGNGWDIEEIEIQKC